MKKVMMASMMAFVVAAAWAKTKLNGAGASFPAPLYQTWTYVYSHSNKHGIEVNYQSVGSGMGISQIREGTVDFAGSDAPVEESNLLLWGLEQFPMVTGEVVPIVNIPGVKNGALALPGKTLAKIFLGEIAKWNDPEIAAANPSLTLPDLKISVVHRADSSGTTFIFSSALAKASKEWNEKVGAGATLKWPVGIGGQKNPGVCNTVAKLRGAIGYTEYTYAVQAKLSMAVLEEPIVGTTYILIRKDAPLEKRTALNAYFAWCRSAEAKPYAERLRYHVIEK